MIPKYNQYMALIDFLIMKDTIKMTGKLEQALCVK